MTSDLNRIDEIKRGLFVCDTALFKTRDPKERERMARIWSEALSVPTKYILKSFTLALRDCKRYPFPSNVNDTWKEHCALWAQAEFKPRTYPEKKWGPEEELASAQELDGMRIRMGKEPVFQDLYEEARDQKYYTPEQEERFWKYYHDTFGPSPLKAV